MEGFSKISVLLERLLVAVIFMLSAVMFLVVFAQVIFRYVISQPLPWSEELARYLMIWTACLAASEAYAHGSHVGVNLVVRATGPHVRKAMGVIIHLAVGGLMGVIAYQGFVLNRLLGNQVSPALEIPMAWAYLAVPVGAVLILVQAFRMAYGQVRSPKPTPLSECAS